MKNFLRVFIRTVSLGLLLGLSALAIYVYYITRDLPNYETLSNYKPAVLTRFESEDGRVMAELATKRRLYLPIDAIPPQIKAAFVSAEDKNFYHHIGVDFKGLARALLFNVKNIFNNRRPVGASTITQQVAKNFLLSGDVKLTRKIKEAILAFRIERAYSKDHILELYLNEINLGRGAYGIASAALTYFNKSVDQLSLAEIAYLASLPKGPANYDPFKYNERAVIRRNWVLSRMLENGYITKEEAETAQESPLKAITSSNRDFIRGAEYFTEEVRRSLIARYGSAAIYEGGLSVRTTLNPKYQLLARDALRKALIDFDRKNGWHGVYRKIDLSDSTQDWGASLVKIQPLADVPEWQLAVILKVDKEAVTIGLRPNVLLNGKVAENRETALIGLDKIKWAMKKKVNDKLIAVNNINDILAVGDVVFVSKTSSTYQLEQIPEVEGAILVMEPSTGRVLSMVGGFSFSLSQFNRATQAYRQVGSAFKPFVYATALDNGYSLSDIIYDGPISVEQGKDLDIWSPKNYEGNYAGLKTLRYGLEHSRNLMTIRLANSVGMDVIAQYAQRFGIYKKMPQLLSMSLGAGSTSMIRLMTAYAIIANGGKQVKPSLVDRIQDRYGHTIYKQDMRECVNCNAEWNDSAPEEPKIIDNSPQILDPLTDYQVINLLQGVVERGTARLLKSLDREIAAKTGTTNNSKDAWFIAFTPDLLVGVYLGYDTPRPLGRWETGGGLAGPVAKDFLTKALVDVKKSKFPIPEGISFIPVNQETGMRAKDGDKNVTLDPFKPGMEPATTFHVIGSESFNEGVSITPASPKATKAIEDGNGGLF